MNTHPYMVLVPRFSADETTMGEWLEGNEIDYVSVTDRRPTSPSFEFRFSSKETADRFARLFIG